MIYAYKCQICGGFTIERPSFSPPSSPACPDHPDLIPSRVFTTNFTISPDGSAFNYGMGTSNSAADDRAQAIEENYNAKYGDGSRYREHADKYHRRAEKAAIMAKRAKAEDAEILESAANDWQKSADNFIKKSETAGTSKFTVEKIT